MADDIVTRLRRHSQAELGDGLVFRLKMPLLSEAADEIERLREQVDSLSKQLDQAVSRG